MSDLWPLSNWPERFPLIHDPTISPVVDHSIVIPLRLIAEGCGITFNAMGRLRHRRFGPRHRWQGGRFIVLAGDLDDWMEREWRPGEKAMLAELQHTDPADFLKSQARSSLARIDQDQRTTQ